MQRNAGEEDFGVENRVDRHTGLTYVTDDARVVRVIAAVGRQVKGD